TNSTLIAVNVTRHTTSQLQETLLNRTGASDGSIGERDKVVLGKNGFRASRQGAGRDIIRSIKHFFTGATGATKNTKAWQGAATALGMKEPNDRMQRYMDSGKELTMRRLHKVQINGKGTKKFAEDFGMPTIATKAQTGITNKFGASKPEEMLSYQHAKDEGTFNNGTYIKDKSMTASFTRFQKMDLGHETVRTMDLRSEKVHLSIHPDDMEKAYEAIAPILTAPDCPIGHWKMVDIDKARVKIIELTDKIANMDDGPKKLEAQQELDETMRLHEGAQFTIYAMEGQDASEVALVTRQLEDALRNAGVRSNGAPESDLQVEGMEFTSFRIANVKYHPGNEGYNQLASQGARDRGESIYVDMRPEDPGYEQFKETFQDNPFYQSLL
ncbi:MAG TPA: hypothetical protein VK956_08235, partial [Verrucomicrobium sp.]|nr:hypothetical protein [Verrucomicrobium sp.]